MIVRIQKQGLPLNQILVAEPQADVLPFQFQNESVVSHCRGARGAGKQNLLRLQTQAACD